MTTYERVLRCAADTWAIDEASLTPETSFAGGTGGRRGSVPPAPPQSPDGPGAPGELPTDSLELVELTMALEEEFELELSDAEAERYTGMTLAELADEIDRLRRERQGGSEEDAA